MDGQKWGCVTFVTPQIYESFIGITRHNSTFGSRALLTSNMSSSTLVRIWLRWDLSDSAICVHLGAME